MKAYAYSENGAYIGEVKCQPSPLEFGKFLIPRNATLVEPPKPSKKGKPVWDGEKWQLKKIK